MMITNLEKQRLHFSGHETFACKQFWLKKGYDFVVANKSFNDTSAVVDLGVGKNMVASIRYWMKSFDLIDEEHENPTDFADNFFSNAGFDPYIEDIGTLWLLHYHLIKRNKASIYSLMFNEFRKERVDFTKEQLHSYLKRKCDDDDSNIRYNENTINTDINVLLRSYNRPEKKSKLEIEESFANMFLDLELIVPYQKRNIDGTLTDWFKIEAGIRRNLPFEIVFYQILDNYEDQQSISFRQLLAGVNSPGNVFALSAQGLYEQIIKITNKFEGLVYNETAGNQTLQIKKTFDKWQILNEYYR
ncbi:DUF4007 family protein [Flavobacterium sp. MK4S-17]|uniref:DUF4007 family protein n=1 Tax=Flavobacterium sp. MK4S-17 TaxID=2543737 RepID=UPI00135C7F98|nr:DUF4007 family protein [Flavobacterium sp. MK4S-17]